MIKAIAFDLDDTLIDTSGILVPQAARQAYQMAPSLYSSCDFEKFNREREHLSKSKSHKEIFKIILQKYSFATEEIKQAEAAACIQAFYNPSIPAFLPLLDGALESLQQLQAKSYVLFLVTAGAPVTQSAKIKACQVEKYFKKIYLMDGFQGQRKKEAFWDIIQSEGIQPAELLTFGNRLGQEIRDGKICGAQTCYFEYGEHVGERPEIPEDHPDFTIQQHKDFQIVCHL